MTTRGGDDRDDYRDRYEPGGRDEDDVVGPAGVPPGLAVGLALWRWWLGRRGNWRVAASLGLAAAALTALGRPVLRAALAAAATAAELISPAPAALDGRAPRQWA